MALTMALTACHDGGLMDHPNSGTGNFETLWEIIDTRYCFLDKQGIDWDSIHAAYAPRFAATMGSYDMYLTMSEMLDHLRDGHVNLSSPFGASYYDGWWAPYAQSFDERVVTLGYLRGEYQRMGSYIYGIIPGTGVGYLRISSFSGGAPGEGNIDFVLSRLDLGSGLIVDLRDNGGGELTAAQTIGERFISAPMAGAYVCHKTGPGHNDFSSPRPITFTPPAGHILWTQKPVMLLTNRSTFSAANFLAAFMRTLPNVTQVGDVTGGGGGIPFSSSLPCGWTIRFSACPMLDPRGELTEDGLEPDVKVTFGPEATAAGHDPILDRALELLGQ
ncbi:MAG: S41 family peptidase [Pseudoflavonifractor sp.]|nr:S41 family peptidase [Alloprevotella sp.]MCM1117479.1 S41 family peptidase [Pseudoflavonifractor sp.]